MSVQGSWTKGKLLCPGCSVRLGGFDYVTRASEPVYLVRSKVDVHTPKDLQQLMAESRDANWPPRIAAVAAGDDESEQGNADCQKAQLEGTS